MMEGLNQKMAVLNKQLKEKSKNQIKLEQDKQALENLIQETRNKYVKVQEENYKYQ